MSLPALVFYDLKPPQATDNPPLPREGAWHLSAKVPALSANEDARYLAAGLTAITTAGFSYLLLRSGDTNSLAGVACTMLALIASRAAARGTRRGEVRSSSRALVLLNYVHAGFLLYAAFFLVLEAIFYRDVTRFARVLFATAVALVAGLPQHWESWRYSDYFIPNNVILDQSAAVPDTAVSP